MLYRKLSEVIGLLGSFAGVSLVSILYRNAQGELSRYLINVGVSYMRILKRDLETLKKLQEDTVFYTELVLKYGEAIVKKAFAEMITSVEKSLVGENERANAQLNTYDGINAGVKQHIKTEEFFIRGYLVKKTVLEKGTYKAVKSQSKTLCKKEIEKQLKGRLYRQFKFDATQVVTTSGKTMEINAA